MVWVAKCVICGKDAWIRLAPRIWVCEEHKDTLVLEKWWLKK
jgi:ribosomal protein L37AE/L43A